MEFIYRPKSLLFLFASAALIFLSYELLRNSIEILQTENFKEREKFTYAHSKLILNILLSAVFGILALCGGYLLLLSVTSFTKVEISDTAISAPQNVFKPRPVRVEFNGITRTEREPTYGQNHDVFKIIYPGGKLIIRENLCRNKSEFEDIINLVEKGMQPALKNQRILVNGTGEEITITSDVADCNNPIWWADLYHMLRNQSKEDASVLAGMFQLEEDQKPLILSTVSDGQNESVNSELWKRLQQIGYLEVNMDQEIPEELNGKVVYYSLTDLGKANLLIFKLATKVRCEELTDDTTPIAVFAEKFLSLCDFHNSLSIQHLEALRHLLAEKEDVLACPGKNQEMVFQMYEIAGALSASNDDPARWSKTTMGQLVAPFILDMYITRKRNHKMLH